MVVKQLNAINFFLKVTKCTFYKYGNTGTVENKDGLCILAQNTLNEKIYIFLWFWLVPSTYLIQYDILCN